MLNISRLSPVAAVLLLVTGMSLAQDSQGRSEEPPRLEAFSFLGRPLYAPRLEDSTRQRQGEQLGQAQRRWQEDPTDPQHWIWWGRRTAYLGRYQEAILIYSEALRRRPEDPRYLSVRRPDLATRICSVPPP